MGTRIYLTNWTPVVDGLDKRKVQVFSQWNLVGKQITPRYAKTDAITDESIVEYEISPGAGTGREYVEHGIILHKPADDPTMANHVIRLVAIDSGAISDDESLNSADAPIW